MTDAMEVEESWHHQDRNGSGGSGGGGGSSDSGSNGVHANKEAGFQAADSVVVVALVADARRSTGEEESHCQGGEAHAVATSPTAEEDGSNLIEAGNFAAGKKSPPLPLSRLLLMRRRLLPTSPCRSRTKDGSH